MKKVMLYKDEVSGKIFKSKLDAIKSEKRSAGIKKLFSFWKESPRMCSDECYQRTGNEVEKLRSAILVAIKIYEPAIEAEFPGGVTINRIVRGGIIGRYLCDLHSDINKYYIIFSNICCLCFREWGQQYDAMYCSHSVKACNVE